MKSRLRGSWSSPSSPGSSANSFAKMEMKRSRKTFNPSLNFNIFTQSKPGAQFLSHSWFARHFFLNWKTKLNSYRGYKIEQAQVLRQKHLETDAYPHSNKLWVKWLHKAIEGQVSCINSCIHSVLRPLNTKLKAQWTGKIQSRHSNGRSIFLHYHCIFRRRDPWKPAFLLEGSPP